MELWSFCFQCDGHYVLNLEKYDVQGATIVHGKVWHQNYEIILFIVQFQGNRSRERRVTVSDLSFNRDSPDNSSFGSTGDDLDKLFTSK